MSLFCRNNFQKLKMIFIVIVLMNLLAGNLAKSLNRADFEHPKKFSSLETAIERLETAANLLKNLNASVDPCDDFYEFACGNYDAWNEGSRKRVRIYTEAGSHVKNQISDLITEVNVTASKLKSVKLVGILYNVCMNQSKIDSRGLEPLHKILERLENPPLVTGKSTDSKLDWIEFTIRAKEIGFEGNYLVGLKITPTFNSSEIKIELSPPKFEFSNETFAEGFDGIYVNAYYKYMVEAAVLLGSDRTEAEFELKEVVEFERQLAEISAVEKGVKVNDTKQRLAELIDTTPYIDWSRLINKTLQFYGETSRNFSITVTNPLYISKLEKVLRNTPKKVIANYLRSKIVSSSVPYLTKRMRNLKDNYQSETDRNFKSLSRSETCVDAVLEALRPSISFLWVQKHFGDDLRESIKEMIDHIKDVYIDVVSDVDWLDEVTRERIITKIKRIQGVVGYPDEIMNTTKLEELYENVDFDKDLNFFEAVLDLKLLWERKDLVRQREDFDPIKAFASKYSPLTINAYYLEEHNKIVITTGILQPLLYDLKRPFYMNYGKISPIIAHEISHGFDPNGRRWDENGKITEWWSAKSNKTYTEESSRIVDLYNNYTSIYREMDGNLTLNENMADLMGIRIGYLAYQKWVEKNREEVGLPEMQYTPNQLFWLSFAADWCQTKDKPSTHKPPEKPNDHSPPDFRLKAPLANSPEFSQDFGCPLGSNMNPINKHTIW